MDSVELVKKICKKRKIPISKLERDCNFSNGYIRKLKEGKFPSDRLQVIADYLGVSIEYLLTGKEVQNSGHDQEYYKDEETARLAQEMFEDPDMRALFDMKRNMDPERFAIQMRTFKDMYRLEHPEEFPEDN